MSTDISNVIIIEQNGHKFAVCNAPFTKDFVIDTGTVIICWAACDYQPVISGQLTCPYKINGISTKGGSSAGFCPVNVPSYFVFPTGYPIAGNINQQSITGMKIYRQSDGLLLGEAKSGQTVGSNYTSSTNYYQVTKDVMFNTSAAWQADNGNSLPSAFTVPGLVWRYPRGSYDNLPYWQFTGSLGSLGPNVSTIEFTHIMSDLYPSFPNKSQYFKRRIEFRNQADTAFTPVQASISKTSSALSRYYQITAAGVTPSPFDFNPDDLQFGQSYVRVYN